MPPVLSELDRERFGIITSKVEINENERVADALLFCETNNVELLIARCAVSDLKSVFEMENQGFNLMDTLVYYQKQLHDADFPPIDEKLKNRSFNRDDTSSIVNIAADCFKGYLSHYYADERLDNSKCDEIYVSWAERSCRLKEVADDVIIASIDDEIVGFATLLTGDSDDVGIVLNGVATSSQKKGVYRSLIISAMNWGVSHQKRRIFSSTQLHNKSPQKVWTRLGFELFKANYTFHKWFD